MLSRHSANYHTTATVDQKDGALTKENEKLKEAMKLMEKNIQRAQCERDLAESNTKDLEYQKGTLSDQLRTITVQLRDTSE